MNRILAPLGSQAVFPRKGALVPLKLTPHVPSAHAPAQNRLPLPRHPAIVVGHRAAVRATVEEDLVGVAEGDADDDGGRVREESLPQCGAEDPGVGCGEVFED